MLKALLLALLEPIEQLRRCEADGDYTGRLALLEGVENALPLVVDSTACKRVFLPGKTGWARSAGMNGRSRSPRRA